jgi:hypothetical protein
VICRSSQIGPIAHGWDILFESGRCDWDEGSAIRVLPCLIFAKSCGVAMFCGTAVLGFGLLKLMTGATRISAHTDHRIKTQRLCHKISSGTFEMEVSCKELSASRFRSQRQEVLSSADRF